MRWFSELRAECESDTCLHDLLNCNPLDPNILAETGDEGGQSEQIEIKFAGDEDGESGDEDCGDQVDTTDGDNDEDEEALSHPIRSRLHRASRLLHSAALLQISIPTEDDKKMPGYEVTEAQTLTESCTKWVE